MLVSIIMTTYNVEQFIDKTIRCIQQQTYQQWELIIVDDHSTDTTVAHIRKYLNDPRIKLWENKKNLGFILNKNKAFGFAQGELLTLMDSDDMCAATRIARQVAIFQQYPEIMLCATNFQRIDEFDNLLYANTINEDLVLKVLPKDFSVSYNNIMFRKQIVATYGLFDSFFREYHGEDQYWTMKVMCDHPLYFIKDILYSYRINPNSLTTNLTSPKQLIMEDIIAYLKQQRLETGTDDVEQNNNDTLQNYVAQLLSNKSLLADRYRLWAVKAIEQGSMRKAAALLKQSFLLNKWSLPLYKTLKYYLTKRFLH